MKVGDRVVCTRDALLSENAEGAYGRTGKVMGLIPGIDFSGLPSISAQVRFDGPDRRWVYVNTARLRVLP